MIICVCKAVPEARVKAAVEAGACTVRDLTRELRVGTCCGKCIPAARECLAAALSQRSSILDPPAVAASLPAPGISLANG